MLSQYRASRIGREGAQHHRLSQYRASRMVLVGTYLDPLHRHRSHHLLRAEYAISVLHIA
eukprot:3937188-Rhodomonas_salina.1